MIVLFIICIFFTFAGLILSKNNPFSPSVLTGGIWLVVISLFWLLDHDLPPLSSQFTTALTIWVVVFCLGSFTMQSFSYRINKYEPSKLLRDIMFWVSIIAYPFFLAYVQKALATGTSGNWAMDLRLAALGKTAEFTEIYDGFHVIIWQVAYIIELFYFSKKNKPRVFILAFILVSFGVLTMAKTVLFEIFIKTFCILFFKKKIKLKHFTIGIIVIIAGLISLQTIRQSSSSENFDRNGFFLLYLVSSTSAFDTLEPNSSEHWGENSLRIYYAITNKLGLSNVEPVQTILPFIHKPIETNTYTIMYPFFKDFGYTGIFVFALLYGLLFGYIFKKSQLESPFFSILYVMFLSIIIFQYSGETLLTNLSGYIKQVLLLIFVFIASKYKMFYIKN